MSVEVRRLVSFMHTSLDGFTARLNGDLDWISYDEELEKYAEGVVSTVGTAVYGRVTYQMMESYWPTVLTDSSASKHDSEHAQWLEKIEKVVFSRTLKSVEWNNARLIKDNIAEEISKLKQQPGKDLVIFGSPGLVRTLMPMGLVDDFRLTVNPVVLGEGIRLFDHMKDKVNLKLLDTKTFQSGVLGLHYRAEGKS